jgi:hypothetical protein
MSDSGNDGGPTGKLSEEVVRFLEQRIDSVPHLEALLIMWESKARWDARQMAARVYLTESAAQLVLQDLQNAGLATSEDRVSFKVDETQALLPQVAESYRLNVTRVATLIHRKASPSIREFARAFDLKQER